MKNFPWQLTDQESDRLNPPPVQLECIDGKPYHEFLNDDKWLFMGYVPTPKSRSGWFVHHVIHGLMMGYPLLKVILFAMDKENNSGLRVEVEEVA